MSDLSDLTDPSPAQAVSLSGVSAGLVVGAQAFQEQRGAFRDVVHQRLAIALHVALGLFKGQAADVTQALLVVLCLKGKSPSEELCWSRTYWWNTRFKKEVCVDCISGVGYFVWPREKTSHQSDVFSSYLEATVTCLLFAEQQIILFFGLKN